MLVIESIDQISEMESIALRCLCVVLYLEDDNAEVRF